MQVITVVGSGGKTSAIREYAGRFQAAGKKVLIVTTTHMLAEGENLCLTGRLSDIREMLEQKGCCTAGVPVGQQKGSCAGVPVGQQKGSCAGVPVGQQKGSCAGVPSGQQKDKIGPLPLPVYREACRFADVVLVEGDGSRGLPAKVPAAWEPVIPENTTQLLVVTGMHALGKTIGQACHRPEEALRCLNGVKGQEGAQEGEQKQKDVQQQERRRQDEINDRSIMTLLHLRTLLTEGYLQPLRNRFPTLPIGILAGQKDTLYRKAAGALLEQQAPEELLDRLKPEWFADRPHLVLFGAGHVATALYKIALLMEYRITVLDDREEFADPARFPEAERVSRVDFARISDYLPQEEACYYAVLTRGHQWDEECVEAVLKSPAGFAYLGMIGSREKVAGTLESLRRKGLSRERLAHLYAPIGLDLGGRRPAEIAVSIAAQLIRCQYGREDSKTGDSGSAAENVSGGTAGTGSGRVKHSSAAAWLSGELQLLGKRRELCGVLAIVTRKAGSAPGEEGSMLFLQPDGTLTGTVGGGSLEYQVVQDMKILWETALLCPETERKTDGPAVIPPAPPVVPPSASACARLKQYDISSSSTSGLNMHCGGSLEILFIPFIMQ